LAATVTCGDGGAVNEKTRRPDSKPLVAAVPAAGGEASAGALDREPAAPDSGGEYGALIVSVTAAAGTGAGPAACGSELSRVTG